MLVIDPPAITTAIDPAATLPAFDLADLLVGMPAACPAVAAVPVADLDVKAELAWIGAKLGIRTAVEALPDHVPEAIEFDVLHACQQIDLAHAAIADRRSALSLPTNFGPAVEFEFAASQRQKCRFAIVLESVLSRMVDGETARAPAADDSDLAAAMASENEWLDRIERRLAAVNSVVADTEHDASDDDDAADDDANDPPVIMNECWSAPTVAQIKKRSAAIRAEWCNRQEQSRRGIPWLRLSWRMCGVKGSRVGSDDAE